MKHDLYELKTGKKVSIIKLKTTKPTTPLEQFQNPIVES
jgi:hypothetical protein